MFLLLVVMEDGDLWQRALSCRIATCRSVVGVVVVVVDVNVVVVLVEDRDLW